MLSLVPPLVPPLVLPLVPVILEGRLIGPSLAEYELKTDPTISGRLAFSYPVRLDKSHSKVVNTDSYSSIGTGSGGGGVC